MILITGATGFVGYHLVKALQSRQIEARCLVRADASKIHALDNKIEIIEGDILEKDAVNTALKGIRQVVHLASAIQSHNLEMIHKINVEGTKNLVDASVRHGIGQFIFLSTINVILPVKNQYSKSKVEAESIIQNSGLNFTIFRPSIIYGEDDRGTIAKFVRSAKTKKLIFILGNGEYKLQPVYVDDVVKAICEVLDNPYGFSNRMFFLVGKDIVSYNELVDLISHIIGVQKQKLHIPLSIIRGIVKLTSIIYKKGIQLEEILKTYPFNKVIDRASQKDVFPVQVLSLKEGLSKYIGSFQG